MLCTLTKSFALKEVDVSNTLLLVTPTRPAGNPHSSTDMTVSMEEEVEGNKMTIIDSFGAYLEPSSTSPKLEKILFLLAKSKYRGPEFEASLGDNVSSPFQTAKQQNNLPNNIYIL